jgi:hypothetical protein
MRSIIVLAAVAALLVAAPPSFAKPVDHDIPAAFAAVLPAVVAKTRLPVLLPDTMPFDDIELFGSGAGRKRSWELSLAGAPDCFGANACFVASFGARKDAKLFGRQVVHLRGGRTGRFKPLSCGASCSPPSITWRQHGAVYSIQAKVAGAGSDRSNLKRMANQAIKAGRR